MANALELQSDRKFTLRAVPVGNGEVAALQQLVSTDSTDGEILLDNVPDGVLVRTAVVPLTTSWTKIASGATQIAVGIVDEDRRLQFVAMVTRAETSTSANENGGDTNSNNSNNNNDDGGGSGARKTSAPFGECQTIDYCASYCGGDRSSLNGMGTCCADCSSALQHGFFSGMGTSCRNNCPALSPTTTARPTPQPTMARATTLSASVSSSVSSCVDCACVQRRCASNTCGCTTANCHNKVARNECETNSDGAIVSQRCECKTSSTASPGSTIAANLWTTGALVVTLLTVV